MSAASSSIYIRLKCFYQSHDLVLIVVWNFDLLNMHSHSILSHSSFPSPSWWKWCLNNEWVFDQMLGQPSLDSLFIVEYQSSNFNTLSSLFVLMFRIMKCWMWCSSRNWLNSIKALDKHHLVRCLLTLEIPSVCLIWLDRPSLSLMVGVDDFGFNKIWLRDRICVRYCKRIFVNSFDWSPSLNYGSE